MRNNQINWAIAVSAVVLLGTAVVTLRAAEHAPANATGVHVSPGASVGSTRGSLGSSADAPLHVAPVGATKQHPPASAPEESATIADDPTTAPDPAQSADNNVSFPTDI